MSLAVTQDIKPSLTSALEKSEIRHDWTVAEIESIYTLPFNDLIFKAHSLHRKYFDPNTVQISTLLSIKTGRCPENCAYCPQSGHYKTGTDPEELMPLEQIVAHAKQAKANGATRFCMGAAWRNPPKKDFPKVIAILKAVKELNLETCLTLGMLSNEQAAELKAAGLDYYNHNIDTSREYYEKVISTRDFQDRLDTLEKLRQNDINVCCGGIMGMGEEITDRYKFLQELANLPEHPQSVPINKLIAIPGTPLENETEVDPIDFVRIIACARIMMPKTVVRLSAGRKTMSQECHALCFFAGANSIHYGDKLLVTSLPSTEHDQALFTKLGINSQISETNTNAEQPYEECRTNESCCS
jgi:biotin synthase